MIKEDLQRIQAFCDEFETSADQLFSMIGFAVCHIGSIKVNAGEDVSLLIKMDNYIYNELTKRGYIKEGDSYAD